MADCGDQLVRDELAVRALAAAYTDAINRGAVDEAVHTYAEHSTFVMMNRPPVEGRDQIAETLRATVARYLLIAQMLHSGIVLIDRDRARARWQVTELQVANDATRRFVLGRYEDECARPANDWRFTSRKFTARYVGDVALTSDVMPDEATLFGLWDPLPPEGAPR